MTTACVKTSDSVCVNRIVGSETTHKYISLNIWLTGLLEGKSVTAHIQREVRIVNNLKAKFLMRTDILSSEKIDLLFTSEIMIINSCKDLMILMKTTSQTKNQIK